MRTFLNYGHDDRASMALRLNRNLESRGCEAWFDLGCLKPGGDGENHIEDGLDSTAAATGEGRFVLLVTSHSVRRPSSYCLNELAQTSSRGKM